MINLNEDLCCKDRETIEYIYNSFKIINQLYDEKDDLQFKINKAIEYIEYIGMEDTFDKVLLEILKGENND